MLFQRSTSGILEQTPVLGLLRELVSSRRSGVLTARSQKFSGKVCFEGGRIVNVVVDGREDLTPKDALREILRWHGGSFDMFYLQWLHPARRKFTEADIVDLVPLLEEEESCLQVA